LPSAGIGIDLIDDETDEHRFPLKADSYT
jgi:hypothetical protein